MSLFGSCTLRCCCFHSGLHLPAHPKMNWCLLAWTYLSFNSQMLWFVNVAGLINNCPYPPVKCVTTLLLDCSFANILVSFRQLWYLLPERSVLLRFGCFPISLITPSTCIFILSNWNTKQVYATMRLRNFCCSEPDHFSFWLCDWLYRRGGLG